ncbi:MAG: S8 family serine peptidase [Rhodanobacteraceae bacterium]
MPYRSRLTPLATAIGCALLVSGASIFLNPNAVAAPQLTVESSAESVGYIVTFAEPGVLHYNGGTRGIPATALASDRARKLDAHSASARAYETYLGEQRETHIGAIAHALGRSIAVTHRYAITMNGIATTLTPAEAARVAALPGVASVRVQRQFVPDTYRGPVFIGADSIWNGSAAPNGLGTRGEGVVVGVIDTGSNAAHPSFANDPTCGFGAGAPKLLSTVDCTTTDGAGICNGETPEADPGNGHGVHTSSTAVGNRVDESASPPPSLPPQHDAMSGVAPCAALRTYKVCSIAGCPDAAIVAGVENAMTDRVDVINFSIGPSCGNVAGESPWSDGDELWLDAVAADIFVAASAGNTRGVCPDPIGRVSHTGPWIATVAASTHDENVAGAGLMSATGPGAPPPNTQAIFLLPGSGLDVGNTQNDVPIRHYAANPIGCTANGGFPPGYFAGAVALIARGNCTYEEKIDNAAAAGALVAVIYNNRDGYVSISAGGATLPAYSILEAEGSAFVDFIDASAPTPVTIDFVPATKRGDVLAGFSLRGPNVLSSITKPDITAPGVTIFAALDAAQGSYGYLSGTSMASPHVAGAAALLRAAHPAWTPSEVKSALMLTAMASGVQENGATPWTPDQVGAGRVDLARAALAGFVLDETPEHYRSADPALGGDPKTLNLASLRNVDGCDAPNSCTWTRTLRDASPAGSSWTVSVEAPPGVSVVVDPPTFALAGTREAPGTLFADGFDEMPQVVTVTATTDSSLYGYAFAGIVFHEANGLAPDARMTIAVRGSSTEAGPYGVGCAGGSCVFRIDALTSIFNAIGCQSYCGLLWLNRFTPDPADYPITITSISTIFGNGNGWNAPGDHVNFYIYQDDDENPANGATLAGAYQGYTITAPINTFTTIDLPTPIVVNGPGDVLIALTNPAPSAGIRPASADQGPFANRSWLTTFTDNGSAPNLSTANLRPNPVIIPGLDANWLIRATGTSANGEPIVLGIPATN